MDRVIILAKSDSLKLVLDARDLNFLIDEPKCSSENSHKNE